MWIECSITGDKLMLVLLYVHFRMLELLNVNHNSAQQDLDRSTQQNIAFPAPGVCSECLTGVWIRSNSPPEVGAEVARLKLERMPLLVVSLAIEKLDVSTEVFCNLRPLAGCAQLFRGSAARNMPLLKR